MTAALYSDESYAAQKARHQHLGLIAFVDELFKLQVLTERIMHMYLEALLGSVKEEKIEPLCALLTTVGALLDTPKARRHMDAYFSRMKELSKSSNVASRMQFMLQVSAPHCFKLSSVADNSSRTLLSFLSRIRH